ncbi:MAG: hypothetical protein ACHRHE_04490 [Tepidisphaerales bacterium]
MMRSMLMTLVAMLLSSGGCQPMSVVRVDRSDYLLAESSGTKRLHLAYIAIDNSFFIFPAPLLHRTLLVEDIPPNPYSDDARRMVANATKERDLDRILRAADSITRNAHPAQIRWIVSTQPLAVAMGRYIISKEELQRMGVDIGLWDQPGRLRFVPELVTEADLNEPVESVVMPRDDWTGGREVEEAKAVTVRLQQGMTIGQLIRQWPPKNDE